MRRTKWRGTILFVIILTVMGATAGLRLYGVGTETSAAGSGATVVSSPAATPAPSAAATPTPAATGRATPANPPPAAAAPAPAAPAPKVVDGATENTPYGPVQVELSITGTQITAVKTLQSPTGGRSDEINSYATPILEQEVMKSQSANIDTVSGATYTSDAYKQSVQSAIDLK
jgi:uncharacterized protein with FMN-binding domain